MEKIEIGKRLKRARKVYEKITGEKMTQESLSAKSGVSRSYIGDIELGRTYPTLSALFSISKALEIPVEYFVSQNFSLQDYLFPKTSTEDRIKKLPLEKQRFVETIINTFESEDDNAAAGE